MKAKCSKKLKVVKKHLKEDMKTFSKEKAEDKKLIRSISSRAKPKKK